MNESRSMLEQLKILVKKMDAEHPVVSYEGVFALMIEKAPVGMMLCNANGEIVIANQYLEDIFGWGREELVGQPIEVLVPREIRKEHVALRDGLIEEMGRRYLRAVDGETKTGETILVEVGLQPLTLEQGDVRLVIVIVASREEEFEDVP